ncbi:MAG: tRNA uridine-5-carboxymethylaminomethyl(34) synthesis GTPase MnmE [Alphaproteobacteria bacterium]
MDTIYARASGVGQAGIAVIRISGELALPLLIKLSGNEHWPSRQLNRAWLKDENGEILDDALAVYFPKGHSYTGEDVVELHIHGGYAVLSGILDYLSRQNDLRLAEAGEFTRRAFENGRMDLTEAEAVADIIHAQTAHQKKQALNQLGGSLSRLYEDWREQLIKSLAWFEAHMDFSDEEIPDDLDSQVRHIIQQLKIQMMQHLGDNNRGEILRKGVHLAIIGAPNAGKSSLLNHIVHEEAAIVSETAGTTRDIVERHLDIAGFPVVISDTAGLRQTNDIIESEGIKRATLKAQQAHLVIALFDGQKPEDKETLDIISQLQTPIITLRTKADLGIQYHNDILGKQPIEVSLKEQTGLSTLHEQLVKSLEEICAKGEDAIITRQRHRQCVHDTLVALNHFEEGFDAVLMAEDLRTALHALGKLTGRVDVEQLLDVIFADFCIGK